MLVQLAPTAFQRFCDNNGSPLAGGFLYTYEAGTTTPQATYTDSSGGTPNPNPVPLNARGEASVWLAMGQVYKFVLMDRYNNLIWTQDNVGPSVGEWPIVQNWGVVGNGVADDYANMQTAFNACAGGTLRLPYTGNPYYLSQNVVQPTPPVSFLCDAGVYMTGPGVLPPALTNSAQQNVGLYVRKDPVGTADNIAVTPIQAECIPGAGFLGNAVGVYGAAKPNASLTNFAGALWGANFLVSLLPSTATYNGQGVEIDLNNHYKNSAGYGMLITGLGEYNSTAGISIDRADTTSDWQNGIIVRKFGQAAILINGSTAQAPLSGLNVQGMDSGHIKCAQADTNNLTANVIAVTNPSGTQTNFAVMGNGGVRIGYQSSAINAVQYGHANSLSPGTIAANSSVDLTVSSAGAVLGTTSVIATPYNISPPAGIVITAWVSAAGTVTIRFSNITTSSITISSISMLVTAFTFSA